MNVSIGYNNNFLKYNLDPTLFYKEPKLSAWELVDNALKEKRLSEDFKEDHLSPLQVAIKLGNLKLCKELLKLGEPVCEKGKTLEETSMASAIYYKREDII